MNGVLIIPTGVGAEIGGHAGDGNPVAKLIATCCDTLITHPNVVNASDINEMTENTLYVEGSMLDRFLEGEIELQRVKRNKVLLVVNPPLLKETINAVSAARATIGMDCEILCLNTPLELFASMEKGRATGIVNGWEELVKQTEDFVFDALALATTISVEKDVAMNYLTSGTGVNPWGGVEAKASKLIAKALNKPVAHAPVNSGMFDDFYEIAEPRLAAETVSICYIHCILKGLHKAPIIGKGISNKDVDFMISPYGCFEAPHHACLENNIPIIIVKENKTTMKDSMPYHDRCIVVENYWEAAGIIATMKAGINPDSVRRPLAPTKISGAASSDTNVSTRLHRAFPEEQ